MANNALPANASAATLLITSGLAFVAGFVDLVGFVALFGLYTAHITGNFVVIGSELASTTQDVCGRLLAIPVFVLVVAATRIAVSRLERRDRPALPPVILAQAAVLSVFMVLGAAVPPMADPHHWAPLLAGLAGVGAMAIQNAAARMVLANQVPTTIMTGNVTQIVIDTVDAITGDAATRAVAVERLHRVVPAVLSFASGAIAGALLFVELGFFCVALPIAALLGLGAMLVRPAESPAPLAAAADGTSRG
jgi:uncharacterized membrane protein YoaK (UPF0700 family)